MSGDTFGTTLDSPDEPVSDDGFGFVDALFIEIGGLHLDDPRRQSLRNEVITRCLPVAERIAGKFVGRGENYEDLLQIARVGLVAAVDRFDPDHGTAFLGFAVPTIMGELRRHFRDHTWAVRVPRRLKEIQSRLGPATDALTQRLGRSPAAREIAAELGVDLAEVTQALIARNAYHASSIDAGTEVDDGRSAPRSLLDILGDVEPRYGNIDDYLAIGPLLAALSDRERQVLVMRFRDSMSQQEIADRLGCSQMQISRVLTKTLRVLRDQACRE
ncbi:RNA polymerase sigma factor SigF [Nocardia wallacei]|uniref:RNA polymerase sigma factor SigF n=1 Tax=Nocardia wallacei TaxID=480035 RepID=UPI002455A4A5|nr:RNA polymerase sigma factor SigF [Nocardia wallacei]